MSLFLRLFSQTQLVCNRETVRANEFQGWVVLNGNSVVNSTHLLQCKRLRLKQHQQKGRHFPVSCSQPILCFSPRFPGLRSFYDFAGGSCPDHTGRTPSPESMTFLHVWLAVQTSWLSSADTFPVLTTKLVWDFIRAWL